MHTYRSRWKGLLVAGRREQDNSCVALASDNPLFFEQAISRSGLTRISTQSINGSWNSETF